ncbi:ATP-binding protein [Fodinicola acaciae]|uniref:ATP-binding protein n=1 Tax=Fodinicola acaciae TaxID=2681555 RepID=UPI0013D678FD|nr:ATP-binding protein [Fodinicola acaciae]
MKIAFVGKGGSGKTTLTSLFVRFLGAARLPVLAVDADINQHLAAALGLDDLPVPPIGHHLDTLKDYLRGDNPLIASAAAMVKTTPPGRGSRLLTVAEPNELWRMFGVRVAGATLLSTGEFTEEDLGVSCYHSKVGAAELLLNHLAEGPDEYVVVDMTAGADSFASGMFTRFDHTFLVAEPTRRGVSVYQQYRRYARDHDIPLSVVGNKIGGPADVAYLRREIGDDLVGWLEQSVVVRAQEQGETLSLDQLEPHNVRTLALLKETADASGQDWQRLTRQAVEFHLRNAAAWANDAMGFDLATQVDPGFEPGPAAYSRR